MSSDDITPRSQGSQSSRRSLYSSPKLRKEALRSVLTKAQELQINADTATLEELQDVFEQADNIHDDVTFDEMAEHQDQIVMDSEVMHVSSTVIKSCSERLTKQCNTFNSVEFAQKLLSFVNHLPDTTLVETNWSMLERELPGFKDTGKCTLLLDWINVADMPVVEASKKERKATQPRVREAQVAVKKPENVVQLEKEETSIEQTVEKIRKLINRTYKTDNQPIDFFKLILDPGNFAKSIENMLHVSFLARDGKIKITDDDEGNLMIVPCSRETIADAENMAKKHHMQNVISLDVEQWRMLKDAYRLTSPMIKF